MTKTLHYVFDPLCGWCYGASKTVSLLVESHPEIRLSLMPSGLFSGEGARSMDDEFAAYAWSNDQRIEQLTGQTFSEQYRSQVLASRQQLFDSGAATVALTAVAQTAPQNELQALEAIQHARYIDGRDVTSNETLTALLLSLGLEQAAAMLEKPSPALANANRIRVLDAKSLLSAFGARGVPTFVLDQGGHRQLLHSSAAYSDPQGFVDRLAVA